MFVRNCQTVTGALKSINQIMSLLDPDLPGASCYTENKSKPPESLCNPVPAKPVASPPRSPHLLPFILPAAFCLACSRPHVHTTGFLATYLRGSSLMLPPPPSVSGRIPHSLSLLPWKTLPSDSFSFTSLHVGSVTCVTPSGPQLPYL